MNVMKLFMTIIIGAPLVGVGVSTLQSTAQEQSDATVSKMFTASAIVAGASLLVAIAREAGFF